MKSWFGNSKSRYSVQSAINSERYTGAFEKRASKEARTFASIRINFLLAVMGGDLPVTSGRQMVSPPHPTSCGPPPHLFRMHVLHVSEGDAGILLAGMVQIKGVAG